MNTPVIPPRSSSKRSASEDLDELYMQRKEVQPEIGKKQKSLGDDPKSAVNLNTRYWTTRAAIAAGTRKATTLTRQISITKFAVQHKLDHKESMEQFEQTDEGRQLKEQESAEDFLRHIYERQAERMSRPGQEMALRRSWTQGHIASKTGLGITTGTGGPRDNSLQSNFCAELLAVSEQSSVDDAKMGIWCPITSMWWNRRSFTGAHLFPSSAGVDNLEVLLGGFSAKNGILMVNLAEQLFDSREERFQWIRTWNLPRYLYT